MELARSVVVISGFTCWPPPRGDRSCRGRGGRSRVEPQGHVVLQAAAAVAPAPPRQRRAPRRPAHRHAPGDVVPAAVDEVGVLGAADGHELVLRRREEERTAVERHRVVLLEADGAAVGVAGVVVARAAGVEEHRRLGLLAL